MEKDAVFAGAAARPGLDDLPNLERHLEGHLERHLDLLCHHRGVQLHGGRGPQHSQVNSSSEKEVTYPGPNDERRGAENL